MSNWDGVERRKEYPDRCFAPIHKQLEEINLSISSLTQSVNSNMEQYKRDYARHQVSLEKHEGTLYGNGHMGLTTRVTNVEGQQSSHKWVIGIVITVLVGIIVKTIAH